MDTLELIRCPSCGAQNRVSSDKVENGLAPVCGRCKSPLPQHLGPITITDDTFSQLEQSALPVLVDLWAPWCGPCRMMTPIIDQLATQMAGRAQFAKMNVDENPVTASRFNVQSIPTLLILKNGREVDRIVGLEKAEEIRRRLEKFITAA